MVHRLTRILCATTVLALAAATAAKADCAGTAVVDRCLVGTWKMTTNGAQEWMRTHIRNFHVTNVDASGNTITLNANGSFSTGASHVTATGTSVTGVTGEGVMNAQASGHWSAAAGKLHLCTTASSADGTATVTGNGHSTTAPIHPRVPPVSSQDYLCAGATFTTTHQMHGDPVVSTYTKVP